MNFLFFLFIPSNIMLEFFIIKKARVKSELSITSSTFILLNRKEVLRKDNQTLYYFYHYVIMQVFHEHEICTSRCIPILHDCYEFLTLCTRMVLQF